MYFGEAAEPRDTTGCRKTATLSAEELFRWRKKEVLPVPQRGGIKDFEPDGSWLQDKRLETFCDEYSDVIAEPRVEKSGNLVKGTWNADMKLVNIEKTAKFWMKMGFADNDRNWLHPEEALFLMEVNCLNLVHHGVSLSLQQAYSLLLHLSGNVSEEEYQVYAHLRRLGYIVLPHAGKLDVTDYEMKIGLHNYTKKKNKKRSRKAKEQTPGDQVDPAAAAEQHHEDNHRAGPDSGNGQQNISSRGSSTNNKLAKGTCLAAEDESSSTPSLSGSADIAKNKKHSKNNNIGCDNCERQHEHSKGEIDNERLSEERKSNSVNCERPVGASKTSSSELQRFSEETNGKDEKISESIRSTQNVHKRTNNTEDDSSNVTEPSQKRARMNSHNESSSAVSQEPDHPHYSNPWSKATEQSLARTSCLKLTEWDFSTVKFPDIGGKDTVWLTTPPSDCLPPNTCMDEEYEDVCMFDVEEYRRQQQLQQPSFFIDRDDNKRHLRQLDFSYGEWYMKNFRPVAARNWKEWKEGLRLREKSFLLDSPVAHLWQGEVTPLVQPVHAESTNALLSRLSVIQPYQGPFVVKERQEAVKISYDVYLPNTTFRKSSPGLPDHRVCIARGSEPPDVFDVHAATAHLEDGVALHWAVVSSGDICFFVLEDLHLPVHPSSLG